MEQKKASGELKAKEGATAVMPNQAPVPAPALAPAPVQFPVILKYASKAGMKRNTTSADRKREIEKRFAADVPRKPDILNMLVDMDKKLDASCPDPRCVVGGRQIEEDDRSQP